MKSLFIMAMALLVLGLSSCQMLREVNQSTNSIRRNREAIDASTRAIEKNTDALNKITSQLEESAEHG